MNSNFFRLLILAIGLIAYGAINSWTSSQINKSNARVKQQEYASEAFLERQDSLINSIYRKQQEHMVKELTDTIVKIYYPR